MLLNNTLPIEEFALHVDCKCMTWGKVSDSNYRWCLNQTLKSTVEKHLKTLLQTTHMYSRSNQLSQDSLKTRSSWVVSNAQPYLFSLIVKSFKVTDLDGSEDNLLHSDIALQQDEVTGGPFLVLDKEDQFTWRWRSWWRRPRKTENWKTSLFIWWFYCY